MIASGLSPSTRVGRANVLSTEISGRLVLMSEAKGTYVSLDPTGSQIWHHLEPARTVAELCDDLGGLYDVDPPLLERDVITFLESLRIQGLVEIVAGA